MKLDSLCEYISFNELLTSLTFIYKDERLDNLSQALKNNFHLKELMIYLSFEGIHHPPIINDVIETFGIYNFNLNHDEFSLFIQHISKKDNLRELHLKPFIYNPEILQKYLSSNPNIEKFFLNLSKTDENCLPILKGLDNNQNLKEVKIELNLNDEYDYS